MIDLSELETEFYNKLIEVIRACQKEGIKLTPISGLVNINLQAKLWRQSRTDFEIDEAIHRLEVGGCPFLAETLRKAFTQFGIKYTDDLPGLSWNNYGEQIEFVLTDTLVKEHGDKRALEILENALNKQGLHLGKNNISNHYLIRKSEFEKPNEVYSPEEIDQMMRQKWEN